MCVVMTAADVLANGSFVGEELQKRLDFQVDIRGGVTDSLCDFVSLTVVERPAAERGDHGLHWPRLTKATCSFMPRRW